MSTRAKTSSVAPTSHGRASSGNLSSKLLGELEFSSMRLGLAPMRQFLEALGSPHLEIPCVLVGGTNGKGSAASLLASMSRAAGYRTGLFTSPHLESVVERLTIDGLPIRDAELATYLEQHQGLAARLGCEPPTFFEALALAAFNYFHDQRTDIAILEVGLGGRLDATNVCEPLVSLITSISFDHEKYLGTRLEAIATEKSGIFRRGRPAVAWAGDPNVERTLRQCAAARGSELILADRFAKSAEVLPDAVNDAYPAAGQRVRLKTLEAKYVLELALPGRHQINNLTVAILAAEILAQNDFRAIDGAAINAGVAACRWPGRLEWIHLDSGRQILLEAAHNAAGIEALAEYLRAHDIRPHLLFGALAEKTLGTALTGLARLVSGVTLTRPPGERAAAPDDWQSYFSQPVETETNLREALARALAADEEVILVCGSLYLVGAVRRLLKEQHGFALT